MPKRFLKFSDRWMFNRVLCEEEVCRKVLRAALGIEVGEIAYLNAEQAKEPAAASRGVRMDVFAREGSRVFDIEMQVSPEGRIGRRMRYYQAAIDATELGPGEDYGLLPESFVVFFCATDPFRAGKAIYSIERTCLELPGLVAGDDSHWRVQRIGCRGCRRPRPARFATLRGDGAARGRAVPRDRLPRGGIQP